MNISIDYSPRRQRQRKEIEQIDRGQNLQSNRDIQLISTSIIKTQTSENIETGLPNAETSQLHKVNSIYRHETLVVSPVLC